MQTGSGEASNTWTLEYENRQGNLWLRWTSSNSVRPQQGKIEVYQNGWPSNPDSDAKAWTWDDKVGDWWDSGLNYGPGWYCAYICENYSGNGGGYRYLIQVVTE